MTQIDSTTPSYGLVWTHASADPTAFAPIAYGGSLADFEAFTSDDVTVALSPAHSGMIGRDDTGRIVAVWREISTVTR